jgi:hypothetical protein
VSFFSSLKRWVVACFDHLPSKSRGLAALGGSGGATCPDDGARAASNHLSVDDSLQWNRWLGVEFQEIVRVVLYLGESYIVMRMDSSTDSHMVLIHPSKISFGFWKRDKIDLGLLRFHLQSERVLRPYSSRVGPQGGELWVTRHRIGVGRGVGRWRRALSVGRCPDHRVSRVG